MNLYPVETDHRPAVNELPYEGKHEISDDHRSLTELTLNALTGGVLVLRQILNPVFTASSR